MGDEDELISIEDIELDLKDLVSSSSDYITVDLDTTYTVDTVPDFTVNWTATEPYSITLNDPVEFENSMPSAYRINEMCKHYPALDKSWKNFKTIYKMVDQDYKGNFEDDDIPF